MVLGTHQYWYRYINGLSYLLSCNRGIEEHFIQLCLCLLVCFWWWTHYGTYKILWHLNHTVHRECDPSEQCTTSESLKMDAQCPVLHLDFSAKCRHWRVLRKKVYARCSQNWSAHMHDSNCSPRRYYFLSNLLQCSLHWPKLFPDYIKYGFRLL